MLIILVINWMSTAFVWRACSNIEFCFNMLLLVIAFVELGHELSKSFFFIAITLKVIISECQFVFFHSSLLHWFLFLFSHLQVCLHHRSFVLEYMWHFVLFLHLVSDTNYFLSVFMFSNGRFVFGHWSAHKINQSRRFTVFFFSKYLHTYILNWICVWLTILHRCWIKHHHRLWNSRGPTTFCLQVHKQTHRLKL